MIQQAVLVKDKKEDQLRMLQKLAESLYEQNNTVHEHLEQLLIDFLNKFGKPFEFNSIEPLVE